MKKFAGIAMLLCVLSLCPHLSYAAELPSWVGAHPYYQGDQNYVLVQGYHGSDMYVDVSSITSKLYEPPLYEISAVVMIVDPQMGTQRFVTETWRYTYDPQYERRRMYVWGDQENDWKYVPKFGDKGECMANTVLVRPGGEFAWWQCYRMNFYYDRR